MKVKRLVRPLGDRCPAFWPWPARPTRSVWWRVGIPTPDISAHVIPTWAVRKLGIYGQKADGLYDYGSSFLAQPGCRPWPARPTRSVFDVPELLAIQTRLRVIARNEAIQNTRYTTMLTPLAVIAGGW